MSKRLQVVVSEGDLRLFEESARSQGLTVSEWARQALRNAERETALGSVEDKVAAVRAAVGHAFPAPDVADMNAEIERGYALVDQA